MSIIGTPKRTNKVSKSINDKNQPTYNITWQVMTDSRDDGPDVAIAAIGINIDDPWVFGGVTNNKALCSDISTSEPETIIENGSNGFLYYVTYTYQQRENNQTPSDPLNSPAEYSFSTEQVEYVIDFDVNGTAIRNTAGDKFDPSLTTLISVIKMTVTQNEPNFNLPLAVSYKNKVNSDSFEGVQPGQCLCEGITGSGPNFSDDVEYWKVTYNFALKADGWKDTLISSGLREKDGNGKLQNIIIKGSEATSPVALDINGKAILDENGEGVKLEFETKESLPFGGIFNFRH